MVILELKHGTNNRVTMSTQSVINIYSQTYWICVVVVVVGGVVVVVVVVVAAAAAADAAATAADAAAVKIQQQ